MAFQFEIEANLEVACKENWQLFGVSFTKQLNRVRLDEVISALLLVIAKKWEVWLTAAAEADLVGE